MRALQLRCLDCGGPLVSGNAWSCSGCGREIPACLGIPDFRGNARPQDAEQVAALIDAFPTARLEDLLRIRTRSFGTTDPKLLERYESYRRTMRERGREFVEMALRRAREGYGAEPGGVAVDLGCGVGASTLALAERFSLVIGVDPSLPDLILARKAADEAGISNVILVAGYANPLPVPDASADFVIAENVLEHIADLKGTLAEVGRVLSSGAVFVGDCVNRYNLLRPEPHVALWGVGFLPRSLQGGYVRRRRDFDGYDRSVFLRSLRELREGARGIGPDVRIGFPEVSAFGFPAWLDPILAIVARTPILSTVALAIFPVYLMTGRRSR